MKHPLPVAPQDRTSLPSASYPRLAALAAIAILVSCGGSDQNGPLTPTASAPAPSPTPSPTQSAAQFEPIPAMLFEGELYNADFALLGHGWTGELAPASATLMTTRPAMLHLRFDQILSVYSADADIAGTGVVFQTETKRSEDGFGAVVSESREAAKNSRTELYINPGRPDYRYRYISTVHPYTVMQNSVPGRDTIYFGNFGLAQATRRDSIPVSGIAQYSGVLHGFFSEDAGGTFLTAEVPMTIDFSSLSLSADLVVKFGCVMGCSEAPVAYHLTSTRRTAFNTFEGEVTASGLPSAGTFKAVMAGPGAAEMLLEIEFPYFNPGHGRWMTYGGIITARML